MNVEIWTFIKRSKCSQEDVAIYRLNESQYLEDYKMASNSENSRIFAPLRYE